MLDYPFEKHESPDVGSLKKIADGVYWLRMPLPFSLNHINLWLLADGDGWTLVDTGLNNEESRNTWDRVINECLDKLPIKRVIVTHMHPDHIGLAGWLTERFGCELWISQQEFDQCQAGLSDAGQQAYESEANFYRAAGYNEEQMAAHQRRFGFFNNMISPLPKGYRCMQEGESLIINGLEWRVVIGSGHSPEHVCLFCPELKLLISGDQVLPRISSNISLYSIEPNANPLANWLSSCDRLRTKLPKDLLVLPSHQEPFYGLHDRLSRLIESHERVLDSLYACLVKPRRAIDCFPAMFKREIDSNSLQFAIGETLAHLNYLVHKGLVTKLREKGCADYYVQS